MLRTKFPSVSYSAIVPLNTLPTRMLPSAVSASAEGVGTFVPSATNVSRVTLSASGEPRPSVEPQPPGASAAVGNGGRKRSTLPPSDSATYTAPSPATITLPETDRSVAILQKFDVVAVVFGYSPGSPGNSS